MGAYPANLPLQIVQSPKKRVPFLRRAPSFPQNRILPSDILKFSQKILSLVRGEVPRCQPIANSLLKRKHSILSPSFICWPPLRSRNTLYQNCHHHRNNDQKQYLSHKIPPLSFSDALFFGSNSNDDQHNSACKRNATQKGWQ